MTRNIIFLDIDGVLNCTRSVVVNKTFDILDPIAVKLINKLCEECAAKIVISSTWRKLHSIVSLITILEVQGLNKNHLFEEFGLENMTTPVSASGNRGSEIGMWLEKIPDVNYVIVDDDTDMLDFQMSRFVHVHGHNGLSYENFYQARKILMEKSHEKENSIVFSHNPIF